MLLDIKLITLSFMCLGKVYESDLAIIRHRLYENQSTMTNFAIYESPKIKGGWISKDFSFRPGIKEMSFEIHPPLIFGLS